MSTTAPDDRHTAYAPVVATTEFAADFPLFDDDDLIVIHNGQQRTDFTISATFVSGVANDARVTFNPGIIGDVRIVGMRAPHKASEFAMGRPISPEDHNHVLDVIEAEIQEIRRDADRAHKVPYGESGKVFSGDQIIQAEYFANLVLAVAAGIQANANPGFMLASKSFAEGSFHPTTAPPYIQTAGYYNAGDYGGARYQKNNTTVGDLVISLADGTLVGYSITEPEVVPQQFGAVPGILSNQQAALQSWLNYTGGNHRLPAGNWRADSDLVRTADLSLRGEGTLDFSFGTSAQLRVQGALVLLSKLSANVNKQSRTLQFAAAQPVNPGDVVIVYNPTDFSFGGRRDVYRDGGMFKVHSLSGNNLLCYEQATDAYTAASMDVYRLDGVRARIEGITIKPCNTAAKSGILVRYGRDVVFRDVRATGGGTYCGLEVDLCYGVNIDCGYGENNSPSVGDEYGIEISSCQNVTVRGSASYATRHAVTIGTYGTPGSVPCRYVTIVGMHLFTGPIADVGAADFHGCADFCSYVNCFMSGVSLGGRNVRLQGCTVFGMYGSTAGMCVQAAEINGGYVDIIDCELISQGDGSTSSLAYILVQPIGPSGGGYPAGANIREDITVRIMNTRIVSPNAGVNARAVFVQGINTNKKVNVIIDGLHWDAPQGQAFLFARDEVLATLPSDFLIVDNVSGPNGAYLIYPTGDLTGIPTREMTQVGYVDTAIASGAASAVSGTLNFRYPYSKMPNVLGVTQSSTNGAAKSTYGNKVANTAVYSLTSTAIRLTTLTADATNFTAADNVRQHWSVGIKDF